MITNLYSPCTPRSLRGYLCANAFGVPRYWATVWDTLHGANCQQATVLKKLSTIDRFYRHVEQVSGRDCLDDILTDSDIDRLEQMLESFFVALRNEGMQTLTGQTARWLDVFSFVKDIFDRQVRVPYSDDLALIQARMDRLGRLYGTLAPTRRSKRKAVRALPASVVDDLYEIMSPDSERNPYRTESERWRNFCLFLLYLHQGLRRGEALVLHVDAIKDGIDPETGEVIPWLNVVETVDDGFDPRRDRPGIKTEQSRRQIPISHDLVAAIDHYTMNFRGRVNHPFMFKSNRNTPLTVRMVNSIFETASEKLALGVRRELRDRTGLETVSPHPLRHTCAVHRLFEFKAAEKDMPTALQLMRPFFGWSMASTMPQYYASAYFENRLLTIWQRRFDSRVSTLRTLRIIDGELPGDES